jgi:uncharacterized Rmd1/YagE family protein
MMLGGLAQQNRKEREMMTQETKKKREMQKEDRTMKKQTKKRGRIERNKHGELESRVMAKCSSSCQWTSFKRHDLVRVKK